MKKITLSLLAAFILFSTPLVFAQPQLFIDADQTFNQHQGLTELKPFIITAQTDGDITKNFGIKISIPADYPAIFNTTYTLSNFKIYGTAVDNGRIDANVIPTFEDKAKTISFKAKEDFKAGESVTIGRLWLKDIYTSSDSKYPILTYGTGLTVTSSAYLAAWASANQDGQNPDTPYQQKIAITPENKVKLTWEDSYDLDVTQIEILRGKNQTAGGSAYQYIGKGVQEFTDQDVQIGDVMEYYILATDGLNRSDLGEPLKMTVVAYQASATTNTGTTVTQTGGTATSSGTTTTETGALTTNNVLPKALYSDAVITDFSVYQNPFPDTDIDTLLGQAAAELYRREVIGGYPDGEFKGDNEVNRAEAAKFLLLTRYGEVEDVLLNNNQFPDVEEGEWYVKYILVAAQNKIIQGYPDGKYRPANTVNTVEFLKMLNRTFGLEKNLPYTYTDIEKNSWYEQYVGIAQKYQLFPEKTTKLNPGQNLTREEVAVAIYQYLKNR